MIAILFSVSLSGCHLTRHNVCIHNCLSHMMRYFLFRTFDLTCLDLGRHTHVQAYTNCEVPCAHIFCSNQWPLLTKHPARVRFPSQERTLIPIAMEIAADGAPVRTENAAKEILRNLGLQVMHADTFSRNDCLTDSLLQSLMHANLVRTTLSTGERDCIALRVVREHLCHMNRTGPGCDYLSHDEHVGHIYDFLLSNERDIWTDLQEAHHTDITVMVYDRFQGRQLEDRDGTVNELPECEPIHLAARSFPETNHVQLFLYCCTHRDSSGYHYEWIRPFEIATPIPQVPVGSHYDRIVGVDDIEQVPQTVEAERGPREEQLREAKTLHIDEVESMHEQIEMKYSEKTWEEKQTVNIQESQKTRVTSVCLLATEVKNTRDIGRAVPHLDALSRFRSKPPIMGPMHDTDPAMHDRSPGDEEPHYIIPDMDGDDSGDDVESKYNMPPSMYGKNSDDDDDVPWGTIPPSMKGSDSGDNDSEDDVHPWGIMPPSIQGSDSYISMQTINIKILIL